VPELGTLAAVHRPLVLLTSNNTRELSEALKRRCLYLFIGYPSVEQEMAVVQLKVPELAPKLAQQAVELVHRLRGLDLRKSPSISETLDWAKSLVALNAKQLDRATLETTLSVLLKHESDLQKAPPTQVGERGASGCDDDMRTARRLEVRGEGGERVRGCQRSRPSPKLEERMEERMIKFFARCAPAAYASAWQRARTHSRPSTASACRSARVPVESACNAGQGGEWAARLR
jgi:hypothetical protein